MVPRWRPARAASRCSRTETTGRSWQKDAVKMLEYAVANRSVGSFRLAVVTECDHRSSGRGGVH